MTNRFYKNIVNEVIYGTDCVVLDDHTIKKFLDETNVLNELKGVQGVYSDEGLYDFFNSFGDYKRVSPKHADILGWEVLGDIISKKAKDPGFDYTSATVSRVDTVTFGKTINQNTRNTDSVSNPFPKYKKHMQQMIDKMGWEIIKFFGDNKDNKMADSHTFDMGTATVGRGNSDKPENPDKIKKMQESYQRDVEFLIEYYLDINNNEVYRKDLPVAQTSKLLQTNPIRLSLTVNSYHTPTTCTIWPYSPSKGWLSKTTKHISL